MTRQQIFDEWARAHVRVDDGLAFRTDEQVECLYHEWRKLGAPEGAYVSIDAVNGDKVNWLVELRDEPPVLEV